MSDSEQPELKGGHAPASKLLLSFNYSACLFDTGSMPSCSLNIVNVT